MKKNTSTRIISISSGKGGVGKTNISVNLALALAKEGFYTCLFDADLGLANINILLGIDPEYTIEHVISGEKDLMEIIIKDFNGIDIISGSSGVEKIANLGSEDIQRLRTSMSRLNEYDFLIFDTSSGIANPVIAFCMAATEVLLVITSDPTSITDAYALLKVLFLNGFMGDVRIVVNQCKNIDQVKNVYNSFKKVVTNFLKIKVSLTGFVLKDSKLEDSVKKQNPFLLLYPDSNATKCMKYMAKFLLSKEPSTELNQEMGFFWDKCFSIIQSPLIMSGDNTTDHKNNTSFAKVPDQEDSIPSIKNEEIIKLMCQLAKSMTDISGELHNINAYLRNGHPFRLSKEDKPEPRNSDPAGSDAIILNYEKFLKNRIERKGGC